MCGMAGLPLNKRLSAKTTGEGREIALNTRAKTPKKRHHRGGGESLTPGGRLEKRSHTDNLCNRNGNEKPVRETDECTSS